MLSQNQVEHLIKELVIASEKYYIGENSHLSDQEFDKKQNLLSKYRDIYPKLFTKGSLGAAILEEHVNLGATITSTKTVGYKQPMLSLQKAKNLAQLESYFNKMASKNINLFNIELKLDGMAVQAKYDANGNLNLLSTRGDGYNGENISRLLIQATISGLKPKASPNLILRGELFMTTKQFEEVNYHRDKAEGKTFNVSRNAVAGIVRSISCGETINYPISLTFIPYSAYKGENQLPCDKQPLAHHLNHKQVIQTIENLANSVKQGNFNGYPCDGIVIKPTDEIKANKIFGYTSHHPVSQIAWKYPSEQEVTTIRQIQWNVGRTGKLTPVAHFDPVTLGGAKVTKASLHNYQNLKDKQIGVGAIVIVEKANEIIPQVVKTLQSATLPPIPTKCPMCQQKLKTDNLKTIECLNENCQAKNINRLVAAVSKHGLDIDAMSEKTIEKLSQAGMLTNIPDLFKITDKVEQVSKIVGVKNTQKILTQIQSIKNQGLPMHTWLTALGIPGLGTQSAKAIAKHFKTIDALQVASREQIASIEGFSYVKADKILNFIKNHIDEIAAIKNYVKNTVPTHSLLKGITFSISGTVPKEYNNRQDFVAHLENQGAIFHSTPKADTQVMIGDINSNSSKIKKSKQLKVNIMTTAEFINTYLDKLQSN